MSMMCRSPAKARTTASADRARVKHSLWAGSGPESKTARIGAPNSVRKLLQEKARASAKLLVPPLDAASAKGEAIARATGRV